MYHQDGTTSGTITGEGSLKIAEEEDEERTGGREQKEEEEVGG